MNLEATNTAAETFTTCKVGTGAQVHAFRVVDGYFPECGQPRGNQKPHSIGKGGDVTCTKCLKAIARWEAWKAAQ